MDNLLHLTVTDCTECGVQIKGEPGQTICCPCIDKAIEEARFRTREESRARVCAVIEERELAEVIDLTEFRISSQEGKDGEALKRDGALRGVRGLP